MNAVLFAAFACSQGFSTMSVEIHGSPMVVEVARTPEERALGLMNRDSLAKGRGMLFVYEDAKPRSFWMKDTRIPLSIAYISSQGVIVRIAEMKPFDTSRVLSLYPAQYALEVNQGWFVQNGVKPGDVLKGLPPTSNL